MTIQLPEKSCNSPQFYKSLRSLTVVNQGPCFIGNPNAALPSQPTNVPSGKVERSRHLVNRLIGDPCDQDIALYEAICSGDVIGSKGILRKSTQVSPYFSADIGNRVRGYGA